MNNGSLILDLTREERRLKVSVYVKGVRAETTLRPYEIHVVPWEKVDRGCLEIINLLGRSTRAATPFLEILDSLRKSGQLLFDLLLPAKAKDALASADAQILTLYLDDGLVHIPWELLHDGREFFSRRFAVGRIARTRQVPTARSVRTLRVPLKVLILADPRGDLEASYQEGLEIRDFLDERSDIFQVDFKSTPVDVAFVKKNLRDYDVVHYAGHANYNAENASESGWLLHDGTLIASEISAMGGLQPMPALVFSNACQSGQTEQWKVGEGFGQQVFGLANAFLLSGVQHYIGTFWDIVDEPSRYFAKRFYGSLADGDDVGTALRKARQYVMDRYGEQSLIWSSYMLYGDPSFAFVASDDSKPRRVIVRKPAPVEQPYATRGGLQEFRPERLYQIAAPGLPTQFARLKPLDSFPHNLPNHLASFIGRESEMAEVQRLLATTRLLTLTGSGGVGKTRLSLQVAAEVLETYQDGVWVVELASLHDHNLVPQVICGILGLREETGQAPIQLLHSYLRDKNLLLILDNCEHLLDTCARVTDALLRQCPEVRVLTTSREPLGIAGETTIRVPSLPIPDPERMDSVERLSQYEAVRLFIERATAVVPTFMLNNLNAPAVAQICHSLDGIPLAIELAAARIRVLSAEQIASRLHDRFRLLTAGNRTALPRQKTLHALIDWSHDLLLDPEKVLFRRLSAFVGGWSLRGAETVGAGDGIESYDILDLLARLVDKSLVTADMSGNPDGELRYSFLETIRQYAREQLVASGEESSVRDRHCGFYRSLAEEAEVRMDGAEQPLWIARLTAERGNLRAAFDWASKADRAIEDGLRLAAALFRFWYIRGDLSEGRNWSEAMLVRAGVSEATQPDIGANLSTDDNVTRTRAQARASQGAGGLAYVQGDLSAAYKQVRQSFDLATKVSDEKTTAIALSLLGLLELVQGDEKMAVSWAEQALAVSRRAGSQWVSGLALLVLGEVRRYQSELEQSTALYEESLTCLQGDFWLSSLCKHNLGFLALNQGNTDRAVKLFCEALSSAQQLGYRQTTALCIAGLGAVAIAEGRPRRAATLFGAAEALREAVGMHLDPTDEADISRAIKAAQSQIDEATFSAAWAAGRAMSIAEAVKFALESTEL